MYAAFMWPKRIENQYWCIYQLKILLKNNTELSVYMSHSKKLCSNTGLYAHARSFVSVNVARRGGVNPMSKKTQHQNSHFPMFLHQKNNLSRTKIKIFICAYGSYNRRSPKPPKPPFLLFFMQLFL